MSYQPEITGTRYMISAGQHLATEAGYAILQAGGNAIDAGVAAGIALGVVHSDQVQFSGVAPIMIYLAEQDEVVTISGLGWWPKAVQMQRFIDDHGGKVPVGLLRTVVPAAPDAWIQALARYGTMSFGEVASAAIRYAREGFSVHWVMNSFINKHEQSYRKWPTNAAIYLPNGRPPRIGERIVQSDLAKTIQYMADEEKAASSKGRSQGLAAARDAFYRGDIAQKIVAFHKENGGLLTADDLAGYRSEIEKPLRVSFRGIDVYSCQPWCQGPALLQTLSVLADDRLEDLGHNSAEYVHLLAEAMNLCFADRDHYVGDPRFVDVPMDRLLSKDYTAGRRAQINPEQAFGEMPPAGRIGTNTPPQQLRRAQPNEVPSQHIGDTSYVCAVDQKGNVFSATPSDVSWEGPVIPGLGFCPSARGTQSWAVEGHPSSVAPGKRPRLTPSPHFCRKPGEFMMPIGAPGGDTQPQGMLQVFLNNVVFGMGVQDAIDAPRFVTRNFPDSFEPHTYYPGRLEVEKGVGKDVGDRLAAMGHKIDWLPDISLGTAGVHAIVADVKSGVLHGGADPRRSGRAMGW